MNGVVQPQPDIDELIRSNQELVEVMRATYSEWRYGQGAEAAVTHVENWLTGASKLPLGNVRTLQGTDFQDGNLSRQPDQPWVERRTAPREGDAQKSFDGVGASPRLLRMSELEARLPIARASIYRRIADGRFPAPLKIGGARLWRESDVDEFEKKSR